MNDKQVLGLGPTRPGTLLLAALLGGVVGRWTLQAWYAELPPLSWGPALTILAVAICEAAAAWRVRPRMGRTRPTGSPVEPLLMARLAVLARASAVLGALAVGLFVGALLWLWPQRDALAAMARDAPAAIGGAVAGVLLLGAALWLEDSCRISRDDSDRLSGPTDGVAGSNIE